MLERYKKFSREDLEVEDNDDVRAALERRLYLAIQATIDLADAVIAVKGFRKPTSYREFFYILREKDIISGELAEKMAAMAGFRNLIAHDYEEIDYGRVYAILQNDLKDIEIFLERIKDIQGLL